MPQSNYEKFKALLQELFMFDQADLDFGIYRIMNAKRGEITSFLENDLLPQVEHVLNALETGERARLQAELAKAEEAARQLGVAPDDAGKVKELRAKLKDAADQTAVQNEVFSHLYNFFSRYYDSGDFISKRRYKPGVYAIPYEGEEVKLHWANSDQYYIKSSEHFRDYAFRLGDGRRVHFKIASADTELNNNKPTNGQERKFFLADTEPVTVVETELVIKFEYKSENAQGNGGVGEQEETTEVKSAKKTNGAERNAELARRILSDPVSMPWAAALSEPSKNPERTLLDRHLIEYTARTKFDYFIHKDLSGFLSRELDFFIKNEIVHLDDIASATPPLVEQYLSKVKALRQIACKIIDFLAQLENFQKRLWLKRKFILEADYLITLDRVPEKLYAQVTSNDAQITHWIRDFAIDEVLGFSTPLSVDFLKANLFLVIDTKFFSPDFKAKLLESIEDLEQQCGGLLIHSENFQALNLLLPRFTDEIKYIYIDPPFNTDSTPILYKNDYRHSSWMSLVRDRLQLSKSMLRSDGIMTVAIDDTELLPLSYLLVDVFPTSRISRITVVHNPKGSITKDFNRVHEYALFVTPEGGKPVIARTSEENETPRKLRRWGENSLRTERRPSFYPIYVRDFKVSRVGDVPNDDFHPGGKNVVLDTGEIEIWPIDQDGVERRWNFGLDSIQENLSRVLVQEVDGVLDLFLTHEITVPKTVWTGGKFDAGKYGNSLLIDILGEKRFDFPKSIHLVQQCVYLASNNTKDAIVMDFFGGSGTTAHAVISLNRQDGGIRKFVLTEMGAHFDSVVKPRIERIIYSDVWENGKPKSRQGSSNFIKYIRLETYEDALNNLVVQRTSAQQELLAQDSPFREDYVLRYMLEVETNGSASLLNIDCFGDPFNYTMQIATSTVGETRSVNIDLVETFNYLLGLRVARVVTVDGFRVVEGRNTDVEPVLVIWRNVKEKSNADLDAFFQSQGYGVQDRFKFCYVNGDNNLENLRPEGASWKVLLIEEEFKRLMFDMKDV